MSPRAFPLRDTLHGPVSQDAKIAIFENLWPSQFATTDEEGFAGWDAYFSFYARECNAALVDEGKYFCARTHEDVVRIARLLITEPTKENIETSIRRDLVGVRPSEEQKQMIDSSIVVAVRILSMVNVGYIPSEIPCRLDICWRDGSLANAIHSHFDTAPEHLDDNVILGQDFTARNIDRVSGIGIIWTDNLADHLRLVERDKKVCMFQHVPFLKRMKQTQK